MDELDKNNLKLGSREITITLIRELAPWKFLLKAQRQFS